LTFVRYSLYDAKYFAKIHAIVIQPFRNRRAFPFVVFLAVLASIEAAIAVAVIRGRPSELPVAHGTVTSEGQDPRIDSPAIDAYMLENLERSGIPGGILAIVRNGRVLHTAGYGHTATGAAVTSETPMVIASLSKSMTAAAMLRLVEDRAIALDDRLQAYLPEFETADSRSADITIRQLLNQTSGLAIPLLPPQPDQRPVSFEDVAAWLGAARLETAPGATFHYCSENYHLLGLLAERLRGQTFQEFLESELFAPLGMSASHVFLRLRDSAKLVDRGITLVYGVPIPWDVPDDFGGGAGGVASSAEDLARWLVLNTSGGNSPEGRPLLSPATVDAMHTASAANSNYAFGWRDDTLGDGTRNVHHSGIARAFTAHESYFPDTGYAYAFVVNGGHFFRVEAASFRYGLDAIMQGREPNTGWPFRLFGLPLGFVGDNLLAILTAAVLTVGIVGGLRAKSWTARRSRAGGSSIALRMAPYIAALALLAAMPWLLAVINRGQRVDLRVIFSYWPPFGILFVVAMLAALTVVATRIVFLVRAASQTETDARSPDQK
jgi:CubicO group peptidase (beta-lactamase class C family)